MVVIVLLRNDRTEAKRRLEATMEENAELRAQVVAQARDSASSTSDSVSPARFTTRTPRV